jgi:hypothetical protein
MSVRHFNISQYVWWVERDSVLIAYYNADTAKYISPTEVKPVTLFYIQRPDKFLLAGEGPERAGFTSYASNNDTGSYLTGGQLDNNVLMSSSSFFEQESEIPEQFHEALVARVIANGYERNAETIKLASYFLSKYEAGVREAKKYSRRGRDGSQISIKSVDY